MWNQRSGGSSSLPSPSLINSQAPIIGPVQPASAADVVQTQTNATVMSSSSYSATSSAPTYTPAQYAAMTPEQQYAVQQHWQQWQAYEQQYAQWHAQYGEQYKREMAAIHGVPPSITPQYAVGSAPLPSSFAYPPPTVSNAYQVPQVPDRVPPPPPPDEKTVSAGIKALPQIYNQPPPPPPPPQNEENNSSSHQLNNTQFSQIGSGQALQVNLNQDSRWSKPPPAVQSENNYWGEKKSVGEGQQDISQYNRSNQQGNKSLQREKQNRDIFEEDHSYENRDRYNTYRGRNRGRSGTSFENNRHDDFEERTNRQQILQQTDNQMQKNTFRNFPTRMNSDISNKNVGQRFRQHGASSNSTFGIASDVQRQQQNEANSEDNRFENSQNNKNNSGSVDEKAFDEQFRLWEEQFESWKKENANHPDRTMYMQYEQEFEKTRIRLLERREQMRRRKMREVQQSMQLQAKDEGSFDETNLHKQNYADSELKAKENLRREDFAKREQYEKDESDLVKPSSESKTNSSLKLDIIDTKIIKSKEITELFKTASGIPGLDLVDSKDDTKSGKSIDADVCSEIIDLEKDGPARPTKFPGNNDGSILPSSANQPEVKPLLSDAGCRLASSFTSGQPQKRKIPSLLDIVVEKPELSPNGDFKRSPIEDCASASRSSKNEIVPALASDSRARSISKESDLSASPGQRPISQLSSISQRPQFEQTNTDGLNNSTLNDQSNSLPPQATDLAKALQDPNVMQLLSVALAQAQQVGGIDACGNRQQNQLIQQLQPLMQMQQQERNSYNQSQRPQPWKNQKQNSNNNKNTSNSRQNRGCFNPFQRNDDEISSHRGPVCGNDEDTVNDVQAQPRNPHNPFRRNIGLQGMGENFSSKSSGSNLKGSCEFSNSNNGPGSAQPPRDKIGRFDMGRTHSTFGISLGFRNNQNNFGDRGGDDDCYRPAQVFDYQNRSRLEALVPPAKVVDYGHKPSATTSTNSFARDNSEFVPVKTIDYGHASSSVQIDYQFQQKNKWKQDHQIEFQGYRKFQAENQNQDLFSDTLANKSETFPIKEQISKNKLNQKENARDTSKSNDGFIDEQKEESKDVSKDTTKELEDDATSQYPNNKWILQNADSRQRPGLPTKRGTRNPNRLEINKKSKPHISNNECAKIMENFEEISDSEDLNEDINNIPPKNADCSVKSRPLFPSVSDSTATTSMVFPSMENNNTIPIDEILFKPGRLTRPKNIVIIIRGPPGSGKSHVAKLIKDKELEMGGATPRLLSIDDYFMIENDYEEKCPKTGRKIPKKEILYEYEREMEDTYMQYLIKSFKKTVTDHLFDFIIVDCCNQSLRTFNEFYNAARDGNFSPFIIDMICDLEICLSQNIHNRNEEDIKDIIRNYQECPGHYIKLDVSSLLENVVEMEDVSDLEDQFVADSEAVEVDDDDEVTDNDGGGFLKSKWDTDPTTQNLARLDGTSKPISKRGTATLEEYLQIDGWEPPASSANGKKRVRWADIEEKRAQDKMRAIGFVVGQTDWNRMMDPTSGSGALTKTKYIERLNKRR